MDTSKTVYHVNPDTGEIRRCTARPGNCRFGENAEHFETTEAARSAYESLQSRNVLAGLSRRENSSPEAVHEAETLLLRFRNKNHEGGATMTQVSETVVRSPQSGLGSDLHLSQLPPLKSLDAEGLYNELLAESRQVGLDTETIQAAADLARDLHEGQFRSAAPGEKRPPYVTHPLRNAIRLIRWGSRETPKVLIGLLHDVVEDSAEKFCELRGIQYDGEQEARDHLESYIRSTFGDRVTNSVMKLSHPAEDAKVRASKTIEQKHLEYAEEVRKAVLDDEDTFFGKLSDMHDNGAGLRHTDFESRKAQTRKQAAKYFGTLPGMREAFHRLPITNALLYRSASDSLDLIEARLLWILSR